VINDGDPHIALVAAVHLVSVTGATESTFLSSADDK
jgi:hypothetical protein